MTVKIWVGTDSGNEGDWDTAANWQLSGGGATVIPASTDDVYFTSGSQSVTDGFIQTGIDLASLNFGTKWTGSIESALVIDATVVDYSSKVGVVYLKGIFPTVNVQSTSSANPALKFDNSTIATALNITGGTGTVLMTAVSTLSGAVNIIGAKGVTLQLDADTVASASDIVIDDGRIITYEQIDTLIQYGGVVDFENADGTTTSITMYEGTCRYKPTGGAVLTTLLMYGGFFDMRGCISPSHTITNTTFYSGSLIDERNGLSNAVYTNPIVSNGGIIKCDLGRQVTVT